MESYDIIIEAGQSNAEGSGYGEVEKAYQPREDVLYLLPAMQYEDIPGRGVVVEYFDRPPKIEIAKERVGKNGPLGDFSLTFAEDYINNSLLGEGRRLLIVRAAIGATGFNGGYWGVGKPLHEKMIEVTKYALSLNPENRVVALLWHQGEHEAARGTPVEDYKRYMKETIEDVRDRLSLPTLPFISGDFCGEWKMKNITTTAPVIEKLREATEECGYSAFVSSEGLLSNRQANGGTDDIHFCRASLYELGHRYFAAYMSVLDKNA